MNGLFRAATARSGERLDVAQVLGELVPLVELKGGQTDLQRLHDLLG